MQSLDFTLLKFNLAFPPFLFTQYSSSTNMTQVNF